MKQLLVATGAAMVLLAGCGPTAQEQRVMDQQKCGGLGFAPGTESFANCMMRVDQQRAAEQAADQRAAAARAADQRRADDAARAAREQAERKAPKPASSSSSSSSSSPFGPSPVDSIRDSIVKEQQKMEDY